jgi:hypothetical protein
MRPLSITIPALAPLPFPSVFSLSERERERERERDTDGHAHATKILASREFVHPPASSVNYNKLARRDFSIVAAI